MFLPLLLLLAGGTMFLWLADQPGAMSFGLIAISTLVLLGAWQYYGVGLPLVPLLALQNLLVYGLPIVTRNERVLAYPEAMLTAAGFEVFVFSISLTVAWRLGMIGFPSGSAVCYALQGFNDERMTKLSKLGLRLAGAATLYNLLTSLDLLRPVLELLPAGTGSIITAVVSGITACGFFLSAMLVGKQAMPHTQRTLFWLMLFLNCYILAAGFLLSSTTALLLSVTIGLFWGSGRVPWKFLAIIALALAFLNLGKFEMRSRYWRDGDFGGDVTFGDIPRHYGEWADASLGILLDAPIDPKNRSPAMAPESAGPEDEMEGQSLLHRIDNLQNILFIIDAVRTGRGTLLHGATYTLIPPLLIPRILWPDKPRAHEGQVLLNVHFGRQDLRSTFQTYVAWGLQAEAYANYGPITGNLILGVVIGVICAWVERFCARKLLLSVEGFLCFVLFLGVANSFEMVASVLVTSIFQSFIPVVIACLPFVRRTTVPRRAVAA